MDSINRHSLFEKQGWLLFAFILLCVECLLLSYQMRWISVSWIPVVEDREKMGTVTYLEKTLSRRSTGSLTWYSLEKGMSIHSEDTVLTGPLSHAKIELDGQGTIELEPETLMRITRPAFRFSRGAIQLEIPQGFVKLKTGKKKLSLKMRGKEVVLKETSEVIVTKPVFSGAPTLKVEKGEVEIVPTETEEAPILLKEGKALEVKDEVPALPTPRTMLFEAKSPERGVRIAMESEQKEIMLKWLGDEGTIELGTAPNFVSSMTENGKGEVKFTLPAGGHYFWRLREGDWVSEASDFTLLPFVKYELKENTEPAKPILSSKLDLRWDPIQGAVKYKVQLSRTNDFASIDREAETVDPLYHFADLPAGEFFWRVIATHGEFGELKPSSPQIFKIKKPLEAPKTKGVKLLPGKEGRNGNALDWIAELIESRAWADDKGLMFRFDWDVIPGAEKYKFQVSTDPEFKKELREISVVSNTLALSLPRREKYFWRVAGVDSDGDVGQFSKASTVYPEVEEAKRAKEIEVAQKKLEEKTIPPPPPPAPPAPAPKVALKPKVIRDPNMHTQAFLGGSFVGERLSQVGGDFSVAGAGSFPELRLGMEGFVGAHEWELSFERPFTTYSGGGSSSKLGLYDLSVSTLWNERTTRYPIYLALDIGEEPRFIRSTNDQLQAVANLYFPLRFGLSTGEREIYRRLKVSDAIYLILAPVGGARAMGAGTKLNFGLPPLFAAGTPDLFFAFEWQKFWFYPDNRGESLYHLLGGLVFNFWLD